MDNNNFLTSCRIQCRNGLACVKLFINKHWRPAPISQPRVDPDLSNLDGSQRAAEVIRYSLLTLEFWLSPLGRLREWIRLNGKACAILTVPTLFIMPLVIVIINQVAHVMETLVDIPVTSSSCPSSHWWLSLQSPASHCYYGLYLVDKIRSRHSIVAPNCCEG